MSVEFIAQASVDAMEKAEAHAYYIPADFKGLDETIMGIDAGRKVFKCFW